MTEQHRQRHQKVVGATMIPSSHRLRLQGMADMAAQLGTNILERDEAAIAGGTHPGNRAPEEPQGHIAPWNAYMV